MRLLSLCGLCLCRPSARCALTRDALACRCASLRGPRVPGSDANKLHMLGEFSLKCPTRPTLSGGGSGDPLIHSLSSSVWMNCLLLSSVVAVNTIHPSQTHLSASVRRASIAAPFKLLACAHPPPVHAQPCDEAFSGPGPFHRFCKNSAGDTSVS
jgi:hypothetical protein